MTRITSFGRKRTYLEASSNLQNEDQKQDEEGAWNGMPMNGEADSSRPPARKKRKRTKLSMRDGNTGVKAAQAAAERAEREAEKAKRLSELGEYASLSKSGKKKKRERDQRMKMKGVASERRRIKRIDTKQAETVCYACRKKGHAAKDCPATTHAQVDKESPSGNRGVVGICYRCGSEKHTLWHCKKPVDEADPLPFASCFVCGDKGHLTSTCPQNLAKGVYPNGGRCKLCGETSHLARNCPSHKTDTADSTETAKPGREPGADEDEFHILERQNTGIDDKIKRKLGSGEPIKIAKATTGKAVSF